MIKKIRRKIETLESKRTKELLLKYKTEFIGKCFKHRNTYDSNSKRWWIYVKIIDVVLINFFNNKRPMFKILIIQDDFKGRFNIDMGFSLYLRDAHKQITSLEFDVAYKNILKKATKYS